MKKYALILSVLLLTGARLSAQTHEKNILGVRAGVNIAWMTASSGSASGSTNGRTGFHISVSDQILLSDKLPFYLETGVDFSSRGGKIKVEGYDYGPSSTTTDPVYQDVALRPMYLQVPLLINYHFDIRNRFTIQPFVGVYYGVGIGGKIKAGEEKSDMFGGDCRFMRSDFGVRVGVGFVWRRIYFGLNGDLGCLNILKKGASVTARDFENIPSGSGIKIANNNFAVSIGYNF